MAELPTRRAGAGAHQAGMRTGCPRKRAAEPTTGKATGSGGACRKIVE